VASLGSPGPVIFDSTLVATGSISWIDQPNVTWSAWPRRLLAWPTPREWPQLPQPRRQIRDDVSTCGTRLARRGRNASEWYDFLVYSYLATVISKNFFVGGDETAALLATFAAFGLGFVARPLGAMVIGLIGDKYGRKPALVLTLSLMGAPARFAASWVK
jgi:hypothetical protein